MMIMHLKRGDERMQASGRKKFSGLYLKVEDYHLLPLLQLLVPRISAFFAGTELLLLKISLQKLKKKAKTSITLQF